MSSNALLVIPREPTRRASLTSEPRPMPWKYKLEEHVKKGQATRYFARLFDADGAWFGDVSDPDRVTTIALAEAVCGIHPMKDAAVRVAEAAFGYAKFEWSRLHKATPEFMLLRDRLLKYLQKKRTNIIKTV